jgi:hypothetical protein
MPAISGGYASRETVRRVALASIALLIVVARRGLAGEAPASENGPRPARVSLRMPRATPVRAHASRWLALFAACSLSHGQPRAGKIVPDFAAIARQALITLPPPPAWAMTENASTWTIDDVKAELAKITDTPPRVNSLRTTMLRPDYAWLADFGGWFHRIQKPLKIRYVDELWDCDNYANCFVAFADLIALKSGEKRGSLCVGWATVEYQTPFAGIEAGGAHAVVIVGTSKGLFVVEPQDGTMVALTKFPNRDTIEDIFF